MAGKSVLPVLSEIQKNLLLGITHRRDSPQHLVRRVQIILLATEGNNDHQIAPQVGLSVRTILTWRHRWLKQQDNINALEAKGDEKALKE
jgi:DNA-binding NarL/FixJ family response regulator